MHFSKSFLDMMVIVSFCFLIFLKNCHRISGLEELPAAPDTDILKIAAVVNDTVNNIFKELHLDPPVKRKAQIEYFSQVHKNLVKLTSRDYANLNEITRLTYVDKTRDKTHDNVTYFMTILDELKNEITNGNATEVKSDINKDLTNKTEDTDPVNAIKKLDANINIEATQYDVDLDKINVDDLMKHLKFNESVYDNGTLDDQAFTESDSEENNTIVDDGDVWKPSGRRIFKGLKTKIKHFPFMATINTFGQFTCAGSIISSDLVITACSCVQLAYNNRLFRENPKFLTVRVGSTFYVGGGEVISVLEVYFHPSYEPKTLKNNLALLRLDKHIRFSKPGKKKKKIMKIALDTNAHALPMNTDGVTIVGWGATTMSNKQGRPWSNRLAYAILDIYSLQDCQDIYSSDYVTKNHFCAGFISHGGGACNRDVGAPGIVDSVLTGVVTFGSPNCGDRDSPTVFTKIGFYSDWIEDIMSQKVPWKLARTTTLQPLTYPLFTLFTTKKYKLIPIYPGFRPEMDNPLDIRSGEKEPLVDQELNYDISEVIHTKPQKEIKGNENAAFDVAVTMLNTGSMLSKIVIDQPISIKRSKSPDSKSVSYVPVTKLMADGSDSKEKEHLRIENKLIDDLIDTVLAKGKKDDYEDLLRKVNEQEEKTEKNKSLTKALSKIMVTVAPELNIEAMGKGEKDDYEDILPEINEQEVKSQKSKSLTKALPKTRATVAPKLDIEAMGKGKYDDYEDILHEINDQEEKFQKSKSLTKAHPKTRATVAPGLYIEAMGTGEQDDYEDISPEINEQKVKSQKSKSLTKALPKTRATVAPKLDIEATRKGKNDDYEDILHEINDQEEKSQKSKSLTKAHPKTRATVAPELYIAAMGKGEKDDYEDILPEINEQSEKTQRTKSLTKAHPKTRTTLAPELYIEARGKGEKDDYEDTLREENDQEEETQRTKSLTKTLPKPRATVAPELDIDALLSMILTRPLNDVDNDKPKRTEGKTIELKNNKHRFSKSVRQDYKTIKHIAKSHLRIGTAIEDTNLNKHISAKREKLDDKDLKITHAAQSKPKVDIAGGNNYKLPNPLSNPEKDIQEAMFYLGTLYESENQNYRNEYKPAKENHINLNKPAKANHINLNMSAKANVFKTVKVNDSINVASEGMSIEMF